MDMTSHAAAIAVQIGGFAGLIGLVGLPFWAMRQSRRDAVVAERAWVEIRAERRRAELEAAAAEEKSTAAPAEVTDQADLTAKLAAAAGGGSTIGTQRRETTPAKR